MNNTPSWRTDSEYQKRAAYTAYMCLLIRVAYIAVALFSSAGNPFVRYKVERKAKEYLQENYPGVYERVNTQNSGDANYSYNYETEENYWSVSYFEREQPNDIFSPHTNLEFRLHFDKEGNLIADGYRNYYLTGGSVYRRRSWDFYEAVADAVYIRKDDSLCGVQLSSVYIDGSEFYLLGERDTYYSVNYTGPYYSPEKEYDSMKLAAEHGKAVIHLYTKEAVDTDTYCSMACSVLDMLESGSVKYHCAEIGLYARNGTDTVYETKLPYTAIDFADMAKSVRDNTQIYRDTETTES